MKTIISGVLAAALLATGANGQESAKVKVASVRLYVLMQNGNMHNRIWLLDLDKETRAAIAKISTDIKNVQQQIVDAEDQGKLNDLQNRLQFLNQKLSILMQRSGQHNSRRDVQTVLRDFIIATYKD
jgi:hypothetical protein